MANIQETTQQKIISLCKRRGFVFPGSEIYGGLANTYDMGPLGVLMLRNIISNWWDFFVTKRENMFGYQHPYGTKSVGGIWAYPKLYQ